MLVASRQVGGQATYRSNATIHNDGLVRLAEPARRPLGEGGTSEHGVLVKWGHGFLVATAWKNQVGDRKSAVFCESFVEKGSLIRLKT